MSLLSHWPIDSVFFVWFKQICSPLIERESVTPTDWESQSQDSPSRLSSLIFRASLVDHFDRLNFETQNCGMTTNCVSVKLNPKWTSDYCNNRVLDLCRWINESWDEYTKKKYRAIQYESNCTKTTKSWTVVFRRYSGRCSGFG